jgi:hypothetical protein
LINRRHYLPRLLLTLSSKHENKNHANDSKMLTGSHHINVRFVANTGVACWLIDPGYRRGVHLASRIIAKAPIERQISTHRSASRTF